MKSHVEHQVHVAGSTCRFSIWFDAFGNLLDAERFDALSRGGPVRLGSPQWRLLRVEAARFAHYYRSRNEAGYLYFASLPR